MKVSIITPTYNADEFLKDCLYSVASQTYKNLEHIIIDAVSKDKTLDIVEKYKKNIGGLYEVRVVSEMDKGSYDAINKGISMAIGDIVGILNADDMYATPYVIESVVNAFRSGNLDAVYGDLIFVDRFESSKVVRVWKAGKLSSYKIYLGWMPPHPTLFVRKQVYNNIGYYNTKFEIAADYDFFLRMYRAKYLFGYIPEVLVRMRTGGKSKNSLIGIFQKITEDTLILKENKFRLHIIISIMKRVAKLNQYILRISG